MANIQNMRDIYYNPSTGFRRRDLFYQQTKALTPKPTVKEVKAMLNKERSYRRHTRPMLSRTRRPHTQTLPAYFPIHSEKPLHICQMDLMDVHLLAPSNNNVNFLLCMIDVLTKKAWVRPLKTKQMADIIQASKSIFAEAKPEIICSDAGSEFRNSQFKKLATELGIQLSYTTADHNRMAVVERFNQSLRSLMERYMTAHSDTTRYINVLPDLVKNYNSRYHTSTHTTPDTFTDQDTAHTHERQVEQYLNAMRHEDRFHIGDKVHYLINKDLFDKGSRPNFSGTTHSVVMIHKHSYTLDNGNTYKYYQLQPSHLAPEEEYYVPPPIAEDEPEPRVTRPQLAQANRQARVLRHENISMANIQPQRRQPMRSVRIQPNVTLPGHR